MKVLVQSAGFLSSVQDLGRTGFRQSGVSVGGALDIHALRVANALVGNDDNAAGIEATLGTLRLHFDDERAVAWCGGGFAVRINDEDLPPGHAGLVAKDEELTMVAPNEGGRAWLAISGGIDVPLVLGSRSTDLRGNFGGHEGRALRDGDVISLGTAGRLKERRFETADQEKRRFQIAAPWISEWSAPAPWAATADGDRVLRIVRGAHWDCFTPAAQSSLVTNSFVVTSDSDRMGARLDGPELDRIDAADLLSEAVAPGTLQVPPNGKPILLLGDCQTIGGYPKIAHVITVDLPIAAQLWPGDAVRFREVSLAEAQALLREREEDFARFRVGLSLNFS
jgi:antagonist of KipI